MKKRIAIVMVIVLTALLTAGCGEQKPVPELLHPTETANAVSVVKKKVVSIVQSTGGYVVPECENLQFDYDTTVANVSCALGDHVAKGQLLLEMNADLADSIKRMELQIQREQTEYDYDLEAFNNQLKDMRKTANAMGSSYEGRLMKLQMQEMQLTFDRNHSELSKRIEKDREELAKLKEKASNAKVVAPCAGTVVYISVSEDGDAVTKEKTFLTIAKDDTKLLACGYISDEDFAEFTGVRAKIGADEYDVTYIPYTDEEVYHLEKTGNKFDSYFTADLKNTVSVGDYVLFSFLTETEEPVLSVPNASISKSGTVSTVTLMREGFTEEVEVETGVVGINETEIVSGLSEGDIVFVAKDLARYGVTYPQTTPVSSDLSVSVSITGVKKTARISEPYVNKVPGKIEEIHLTGYTNIIVHKGDPIFSVKASIGRADQEQAKIELRKATNDFEDEKKRQEEAIDELKDRMKKMKKTSLEYALAELDLADLNETLTEYVTKTQESIDEMTKRIADYEAWNDQVVTLYAEKDCVIGSISKYKVGDTLNEGAVLFDTYDLNSYYLSLDKSSDDNSLRYGQKVTFSSYVDGEQVSFSAHVFSAPNVRPNDVSDKDAVFLALDDESAYAKVSDVGVVSFDEYNLSGCMLVDETYIARENAPAKEQQSQQGFAPNNQNWGGFNWGDFGGQQVEQVSYEKAESQEFDSAADESKRGRAYVWVYDEAKCIVKRYVRVMTTTKGNCWIIDGLADGDILLQH